MRHDYDLPPEWSGMSEEERSRWMTQERCRRLYQRVQAEMIKEERQAISDRVNRLLEAKGFVNVRRYR